MIITKTKATLEEAKELYEQYKQSITFKNYYKDEITLNYAVLNQGVHFTNNNYPYGYLRTDRVVYVETTKRGDRFVTQTKNPKSGEWNKPKKSTYVAIKIHVLTPEGKNGTVSLDFNDSISKIEAFEKAFILLLNDKQKEKLAEIKAYNKVMENVTFEIKKTYYKNRETGEISESVSIFDLNNVDKCTKEGVLIDEEKEKQEQKEVKKTINEQINMQSYLNKKEMGLK